VLDEMSLREVVKAIGYVIEAPECLAFVLEAAGGVTLERCGAILDERVAAEGASGAAAG
jgi:nicotinate-nucleotide pyrophosphorylase